MEHTAKIKTIKVIHLALLIGQLLFLFVNFFVLVNNPSFDLRESDYPFIFINIGMAVFALFIGKMIYNKRIGECVSQNSVSQKFNCFQSAMIIKLALIEGIVLLSIVFFMMHSSYYFLLIAIFLIIIFITLRPTTDFIQKELQLSNEEIAELL